MTFLDWLGLGGGTALLVIIFREFLFAAIKALFDFIFKRQPKVNLNGNGNGYVKVTRCQDLMSMMVTKKDFGAFEERTQITLASHHEEGMKLFERLENRMYDFMKNYAKLEKIKHKR